jgi:hypothetical protein
MKQATCDAEVKPILNHINAVSSSQDGGNMRIYRVMHPVILYSLLVIFSAVLFNPPASAEKADSRLLHYNQDTLKALDHEIAQNPHNERYISVLKGLRWCVIFFDNDKHFNATFYNYLIMLDELSVRNSQPKLSLIVHDLILNEFDRVAPRLSRLLTADVDGYETLISLLPIIYHHKVPIAPFKQFADEYFNGISYPDQLKEFRRSVKKLDYSGLTNLISNAACLDMAYSWKAEKNFRLPPNYYEILLKESLDIPFLSTPKDDNYDDQNYFATHLIFALNHYGQRPYTPSELGDKLFFYLIGQYMIVRHQSDNLDIMCEYLYCLRQFGLQNAEFIIRGEKYVVSLQRPDGAWGQIDNPDDSPYHRMHPTWTAISMLNRGM